MPRYLVSYTETNAYWLSIMEADNEADAIEGAQAKAIMGVE